MKVLIPSQQCDMMMKKNLYLFEDLYILTNICSCKYWIFTEYLIFLSVYYIRIIVENKR